MISRFYVPSHSGDYRIEAAEDWRGRSCSTLTVENPTVGEVERLQAFLRTARDRDWVSAKTNIGLIGVTTIKVRASVADAGPLLMASTEPLKPGVLVAVRSIGGVTSVVTDAVEAEAAVKLPQAEEATVVRRPTPCCPDSERARELRASDVLRAFCTPAQWASWMNAGYLIAYGNLTGHAYRIAHRHSAIAARQRRICADLDDGATLHFHDSLLPAPEEALNAKIVLEHREDWLRNRSTCLSSRFTAVFQNPLGHPVLDGIPDAQLTRAIGGAAIGWRVGGGAPLRALLRKVAGPGFEPGTSEV